MIRAIVEGQGEVAAVPILLRRLREAAEVWGLELGQPHRRSRSELLKKELFQRAIRVALHASDCTGLLILLDADDACPVELAAALGAWARELAGAKRCEIVLANREYEAFFLASIESLRGKAGILEEARSHPEPERPRDAKGELSRRMPPASVYSPSVDQAPLTAHLDLAKTYRACRSFRKLVDAFGALAVADGHPPREWPPATWLGTAWS